MQRSPLAQCAAIGALLFASIAAMYYTGTVAESCVQLYRREEKGGFHWLANWLPASPELWNFIHYTGLNTMTMADLSSDFSKEDLASGFVSIYSPTWFEPISTRHRPCRRRRRRRRRHPSPSPTAAAAVAYTPPPSHRHLSPDANPPPPIESNTIGEDWLRPGRGDDRQAVRRVLKVPSPGGGRMLPRSHRLVQGHPIRRHVQDERLLQTAAVGLVLQQVRRVMGRPRGVWRGLYHRAVQLKFTTRA